MQQRNAIFICIFSMCMLTSALAETELSEPRIESIIGQTLDIRIPITGNIDNIELLNHDAYLYAKADIPYLTINERIIVELVTTVSRPYIAVSSIGSISDETFRLVVGLNTLEGEVIRQYTIALPKPVQPPPIINALSPAELLVVLLAHLSLANDVSRAEILDELYRIVNINSSTQILNSSLILKFGKVEFNSFFINGFKKLLDNESVKTFSMMLTQQNNQYAVYDMLFNDDEHIVLKKLLSNSVVSSFKDSGSPEQRLTFMKERVAILENQMMHLQQMVEQRKKPSQVTPSLVEQIYQIPQLIRSQWQWETLLSRQLWLSASLVSLILFVLMIWRRFRYVKNSSDNNRSHQLLPGQKELEKELGLAQIPSDIVDEKTTELDNEINLASMYIEMGNNVTAIEILDQVIRKGNSQQKERAKLLKQRVKGDA